MKTHTTNYQNTFMEIAPDCPVEKGTVPPFKGNKKSIATMQFEVLHKNPYTYSSDDLLFQIFTERNDILKENKEEEYGKFFSKGKACLRTSPLTKRYGFGIHHNDKEKIAIFGAESEEYAKFVADKSIKNVKAKRSKRA